MEGTMDLSNVVSMIMKHPELIETIANLAKAEGSVDEAEHTARTPLPHEEHSSPTHSIPTFVEEHPTETQGRGENRKRLFSAIRPFLSEERAKTLSGVEAVVSILDSLHS